MLTGKQRAFLRTQANPLTPIVHMGKGEITEAIIKQADDALIAREIIKCRVLETCAMTAKNAAEFMAGETNAEIVQVIGRNFVLYRRNEKEPKITLPRVGKEKRGT